jgi:hypothetical protein
MVTVFEMNNNNLKNSSGNVIMNLRPISRYILKHFKIIYYITRKLVVYE